MNTPVYTNLKIEVTMKDEETLDEFRKQIEAIYEIPAGSFLITYVSDQQMQTIFHSSMKIKDINSKNGVILLQ